jgi:hypothetical protein
MLQGHLENIQEDGLITGWCWDPDQPARRARLTVLVDNEPIGDLIADNFRPDLESAGIGDGAHAFAFLLPWSAIASRSVTSVHVADPANNNRAVGGALTFRRTALLPVEQRIAELEHNTRLLQARLEEASRHADRTTALVQSTLATIGAFFTQLAEMPLAALPRPGLAGVSGLLASARAEFAPFSFSLPAKPLMTICISGEGGLGEVYGCLRALKACGIDDEAEIVFIDAGYGQETGLIPLLVHNLRYWPVGEAQSLLAARNRLGSLGARDMLLFLAPAVRMRDGWLDAVKAVLAAHPRCAVLGSAVLRADGTIQSSALTRDRSGRLSDFGYAEMPEAPWHNRLAPVAAVPDHAMLIRRSAFEEVEGFDPAYGDLAPAATDLCLRCWAAGHSVLYQPGSALHWQDGPGSGAVNSGARDTGLDALLAERWQAASRTAWPAATGRALLIDAGAAAVGTTLLQSAQALQALAYDVAFGDVTGLGAEDDAHAPLRAPLRAIGVEVLKAPYHPSVVAAIKAAAPAFDIIQISPAAAAYLSPETIRGFSPNARIVMAMDAAAERRLTEGGRDEAAPLANALANALAAADAIIAPTGLIHRALPPGAQKSAVAVLMPAATPARTGLWLLLDGPEDAVQDAGRWLATLLPALAKAVPGCAIHTVQRDGLRLPASVQQHAVAAVADGEWLGRMRLAVAPFRRPALDPAALAACAAAGLPVIATTAALGGHPPAPGVVEVAANAQAMGRLLRSLEDAAAWEALAAPRRAAATTADWVAAYRSLATRLKRAGP